MFWIKTAFFFLLRSGRTTVALFIMVFSAVTILVFLAALATGINDTMIKNSVGLYPGHISGFALSRDLKIGDLEVEGVSVVLKRVPVPGILSSGDRRETLTMIGIDPARELKHTSFWKKTVLGKYPKNGEQTVFLGSFLAEQLDVRPGDSLVFNPGQDKPLVRLTLSGIYQTGIERFDRDMAFCPQNIAAEYAGLWEAGIFLKEGTLPYLVTAALNKKLHGKAAFQSWQELMPDLKQLIDLNYVSMGLVMVLVFGVISFGIACGFVIFILKNLREYGIMKTMGVSASEMTFLIVGEVILINMAACCLGVLAGVMADFIVNNTGGIDLTRFTSHNRYFIVSGIIYPRLSLYSLCLPPSLAFLFGLLAAIWPVCLVVRKKAADILRAI